MSTPQDSPFRLTGRAYVDTYLLPFLAQYAIQIPHVDIVVNPNAGQVTVNSREFSSQGETGRYINSKTFSYLKQDLDVMYPHPMLYNGPWPTTYRALIQWLNTTYGWVIETDDFLIATPEVNLNPTLDTVLGFKTDQYRGTFQLLAKSNSMRFKAASSFELIVQPTNERTRLESLYEVGGAYDLMNLVSTAESNTTLPTLFTANGEQCAIEALRMLFGYVPARDQFTLAYSHTANSYSVSLTAVVLDSQGGPGLFSGDYAYGVIKADLSSMLDGAILNIDGSYPQTYESFTRYMRNNFGFAIEPGEFYIASDPNQQLLMPGSPVQFVPDSNKQDFLTVGPTSKRWCEAGRVPFNLLNV